jgi:leader peptidase (prepilin peptidase)/N-methyltransferase
MLLLSLFLLGLIIGSFLNVVVLRSEKEESLGGRSHCPWCQALIHWYDNIPVFSFLMLRGKCRACAQPIHWQYPLVELATGLVFTSIGYFFTETISHSSNALSLSHNIFSGWGTLLVLGGYLTLASILITILVSDLRTMEIPLVFLVAGFGAALLLVGFQYIFPTATPFAWRPLTITNQLLGGGVAALIFYALVFFSRETWMGMGDVWIAAILGLTVGLDMLLFSLTLSFSLGSIIGIVLLSLRRKGWQSPIAFAPFLIVALFASWFIQWSSTTWVASFILPWELFF